MNAPLLIERLKYYKKLYNTTNFDVMIDVLTNHGPAQGSISIGWDYMGMHILEPDERKELNDIFYGRP